MKIKAVIYDCVGPLLIKKRGWHPSKTIIEINTRCGDALNDRLFWHEIKKEFSSKSLNIDDIINKISSGYKKNLLMWQFHRKIKNKYKTGIINNGTFRIFNKWVNKYNFKRNFDILLNSAELGIKKPDRKIFKVMCEKLKVKPEECLFIDDSTANTNAAQKAGMNALHYDLNNHARFLNSFNKLEKLSA